MKIAYGVVWREGGVEQAGRLALDPYLIRLSAHAGEPAVTRELSLEEIAAVELRRSADEPGRPVLVLKPCGGGEIEIESAADRWIVRDLLEKVFIHILEAGGTARRILLAVRLEPGCRDAARELLRAGPPFEPTGTALVAHDAFLLDDEVLFLFELRDRDEAEQLLALDLGAAVDAWLELATGEVRMAEHAYTWSRGDLLPAGHFRPGLGF